jgi:hypothetical protein
MLRQKEMGLMENFNTKEITSQQRELVIVFLDSLKREDVNLFWDVISEEDKEFIKGTYRTIMEFGEVKTNFNKWVLELLLKVKGNFSEYLINYGITTIVRYENKLKAKVYIAKDIQTEIHFIKDTEFPVLPISIILNLVDTEQGIGFIWKIKAVLETELLAP